MWTLFKLIRLLITIGALWWLYTEVVQDGATAELIMLELADYGPPVFWSLLVLWLIPLIFQHKPPKAKKHNPTKFSADVSHDNVALDLMRNILWIRDPEKGERQIDHGRITGMRTTQDVIGKPNTRIELQVLDVRHPSWQVRFQRHSDFWRSGRQRNMKERDEWYARILAWSKEPVKKSYGAMAREAGIDTSLPGIHRDYYEAKSDDARHNLLVAFDITCMTEKLEQKVEWERLGGTYPGPSPDLLKFQK